MSFLAAVLAAVAAGFGLAWARERGARRAALARHRIEAADLRVRREAELREQAQRTSALFDRMVEGIIVVGAGGRIRLANRAAGELFGFEAPAGGKTILEATRNHEVAAVAARLEHEPEVLAQEVRLEARGTSRFLQFNALALRDAAGGQDGAILVFHDLTRLRELEGVRQEFVANVSHELRTPLSLIKSSTETLLDGAKEDAATLLRFLQIIDKHANRLTLLIDDLLLLSTLDSGGLRLNRQPVALRSAVQEAMDDLEIRARARSVVLENSVPPALIVRADADRLRQVLSNLLDNAIKYGRAGGRTRVTGRTLPEGRVELAVADDGPGIPAEAQARVFERFYRVDKARSREQGGTGLGLAIVKHVVQAHDGEVRVESPPGAGATFFVTLPSAGLV
jgi:two-component system phosphate regulon sensor histidine kinase PhoR